MVARWRQTLWKARTVARGVAQDDDRHSRHRCGNGVAGLGQVGVEGDPGPGPREEALLLEREEALARVHPGRQASRVGEGGALERGDGRFVDEVVERWGGGVSHAD